MAGKTYSLYRTTDLSAGWSQPIATGIGATPPLNSYTDTVSAAAAFYMVGVQ